MPEIQIGGRTGDSGTDICIDAPILTVAGLLPLTDITGGVEVESDDSLSPEEPLELSEEPLELPPEFDEFLLPPDAFPARSASSCAFVIQVELPESSLTQSCLVLTRFAKKSPMPLPALANHCVTCVMIEWKKSFAKTSVEVAFDDVALVLVVVVRAAMRALIESITPPIKSRGLELVAVDDTKSEVMLLPRSPTPTSLMSIPF